jgi:hypothetical protein
MKNAETLFSSCSLIFWLIRQLILINCIQTIPRKLHHVHWFLHELKPVYTINSCALYHECLVWILLSLYLYYSSPDCCSILIHIFQNAALTSVDPTFFPSYIIVFSPILIPCLNYIPPKACTQKHFALTLIINVHVPFGFVE